MQFDIGESLKKALDLVDRDKVVTLVDLDVPVTRVRWLDDQLLARLGEGYVESTGELSETNDSRQQLGWRFGRLRGKLYSTNNKEAE